MKTTYNRKQRLKSKVRLLSDTNWQQVKTILDKALTLPTGRRAEYLDEICGADAALRQEVDSLLAADQSEVDFMEEPLVEGPPKPPPIEKKPRETVGPYRIIRELGRGGMGTVYLTERTEGVTMPGWLAVKLLEHGWNTPTFVSRFKREQLILAGLSHPNIARLHQGGISEDGLPYLVMEFIDGPHLTEYCRRRNLSIRDRLGLFVKVCEAVRYAHANLVIHRDLKPSNILITGDGEPKLLDFGIARTFDPSSDVDEATVTLSGWTMLTPEYASPEQVSGKRLTTAHDIYSLGVILYLLLTGRLPHKLNKESLEEVFRSLEQSRPDKPSVAVLDKRTDTGRVQTGPPGSGRKLHNQLKGDLDTIVMKAMHRDPQQRYDSVEAFMGDVTRYLAGFPIHARPETRLYVLSRFLSRHRRALVAVLLVLAFTATALYQKRQIELQDLKAQKTLAMLSFLGGIDTGLRQTQGPDTRTLLDEIRRDLRLDEMKDPGLRMRTSGKLAAMYLQLGHYREAEQLYENLLAQAEISPEYTDVMQRLTWMQALADTQSLTGRFSAAHVTLQKACNLAETGLKSLVLRVEEVKNGMRPHELKPGQKANALSQIYRKLALNALLSGNTVHLDRYKFHNSIQYRLNTEPFAALFQMIHALMIGKELPPQTLMYHSRLMRNVPHKQQEEHLLWLAMVVRSAVLYRSDRFEESEETWRQACLLEPNLFPGADSRIILHLLAGARLLQHQDRFEDAAGLLQRLLETQIWLDRNDMPTALALLRRQVTSTPLEGPEQTPLQLQSLGPPVDAAYEQLALGNHRQADAILDEVDTFLATLSPDLQEESLTMQIKCRIAGARTLSACRRGAFTEAEAFLERAEALADEYLGPQSGMAARLMSVRGYLTGAKGNRTEARRILARAHDRLEAVHGGHALAVTDPLLHLARLSYLDGNWNEAEKLAGAAYQLRRGILAPDHGLTIEALALYADILENLDPARTDAIREQLASMRDTRVKTFSTID
ncbi:MAG: serine/threonine-protein kinase [Acidobacteriota bacterium]|nr:serine/threonine-protein kinase [Acidobacteriota bacterium]